MFDWKLLYKSGTRQTAFKKQKNKTSLWLFLINFTYQNKYLILSVFAFLLKKSVISGRFTVVNERHVLSVFFYAGISKFPSFKTRWTKAPKAHDAVPVFCEHPLKVLNAKTIKFWYCEGQLVSVPKG